MHSLLLVLSMLQGMWIDVPWVPQEKNGCGSASVWMVMQHWKHGADSLEDIHSALYSEKAGGVFASDMEKYFAGRGYRTFAFSGKWADLEQHLAKGRPLIVVLERNARGVPLHYVVVSGINTSESTVLVNDPAGSKLQAIERSDFERAWRATDNWTLLAVPEVQLASEAFREDRLLDATEHLKSVLRAEPSDPYATEFIATVHFLDNNVESALKYWNRLGKPIVSEIRFDPPLATRPVIIDRALAFRRGNMLTLDDYQTTRARFDAAGIFSRYQIELAPSDSDQERFDVMIRGAEKTGPGLLGWFRGLPYQTIHPEFSNIGGRALSLKSLVRWDSSRRRAGLSIQAPLRNDPKWMYRFEAEGRDELWRIGNDASRLRKTEVAMQIHGIPSGSWDWSSGLAFSNRKGSGSALKYRGAVNRILLYRPETRFQVGSSLATEIGRQFAASTRFAKVAAELTAHWFPRSRDDYELSGKVHVGSVAGAQAVPIDERIVFGLDRDPALALRGHRVFDDGAKSAAATTSSIILFNTDFQKTLAQMAFVRFEAGPFFDVARPAARPWLLDAGIQVRVTALNTVTFALVWGRDLRNGRSTFFTNSN